MNKNQTLFGMLHCPRIKEGEKSPGIVMFHGFAGTSIEPHQLFVKAARRLADLGFFVLRFDFRGSGQSEGNFEEMTFSEELSDAQKALDFLSAQPQVDENRLGAIGLSMGGAVACYLASSDGRLKAVALWSTPVSCREIWEESVKNRRVDEKGYVDYDGNKVGKAFLDEVVNITPATEIGKFQGPVLIIHGDRDETVPVKEADLLYDALEAREAKTEKRIIEDGGHTYDSIELEEVVITTTCNWFMGEL